MSLESSQRDSVPPGAAPAQSLTAFIAANFRFLAFGFLLIFFASFGQTFYVGLFGSEIRGAFHLSHGEFGAIYSIATLLSALLIAWTGAGLDRMDLRLYAGLVCAVFVVAHFVMASAAGIITLGLAIFLLRQAGMGLMVHTGQTSMARYFDANRGRAISLVTMGIAAGEAVFPMVAVTLIATLGWRGSWVFTGAVLAVLLIPLNLWLLRGHGERHRRHLKARYDQTGGAGDRTRGQVIRDVNFYLILLPFMGITFLITGLFFHQGAVAEAKGWELSLVAKAFVAYSLVRLPSMLACGFLIDRIGARRLVPVFLVPMGGAMLVLAFADHRAAVFGYLALAGLTTGGAITLLSAVWAEIYGVTHLGAIRSMVMSIWVASGAASTWVLGYFFDAGATVGQIAIAAFIFIVVACLASWVGVARTPASGL